MLIMYDLLHPFHASMLIYHFFGGHSTSLTICPFGVTSSSLNITINVEYISLGFCHAPFQLQVLNFLLWVAYFSGYCCPVHWSWRKQSTSRGRQGIRKCTEIAILFFEDRSTTFFAKLKHTVLFDCSITVISNATTGSYSASGVLPQSISHNSEDGQCKLWQKQ